jgi:hypothetical protein
MNEKQLGEALLKLDGGSSDPRRLTWKVLDRDRRLVRFLAGITVLLWLAAAVIAAHVIYVYTVELQPIMPRLMKDHRRKEPGPSELEQMAPHLALVATKGVFITAASVGTLTLATLGTLLLIFASRRATLRQINSSLLAITEDLARLRAPPPGAG